MGNWSWVMWVMGQLCDGSHGSWITKDDPFPTLCETVQETDSNPVKWFNQAGCRSKFIHRVSASLIRFLFHLDKVLCSTAQRLNSSQAGAVTLNCSAIDALVSQNGCVHVRRQDFSLTTRPVHLWYNVSITVEMQSQLFCPVIFDKYKKYVRL